MRSDAEKIYAVPTNIITGFLGTGKTSAILSLLHRKPAHERWAVLVNEFGEIGVDGSMFQGQKTQEHDVFIREVPGGCMCCTSGLPMQIALNQLLKRAKPDRVLIEPTGLGHPKEILQTLSDPHYRKILSLDKILTLVDARKLSDRRYTEHDTFLQQIAIADTLVGNKLDLYQQEDKSKLLDFVKRYGSPKARVIFTQHGEIIASELCGKTAATVQAQNHRHVSAEISLASDPPMPVCGYIKAFNQGEGFQSVGWRITPKHVFNREKLFTFLSGIKAERMKAVFITASGIFAYNLTADALTEVPLDECMESRIEIIGTQLDETWEEQLMNCILRDD